MVGPFCFVLHFRLAGIAGRNKLLINMVQGSRSGFAAFFIGRCSKVVF